MFMSQDFNPLVKFSEAMADAVAKAGAATVLVNARHRMPASGIVYAPDWVVTANHVVEVDEGITVLLEDGTEVGASVSGRDPTTDLAVLHLVRAASVAAEPVTQEARIGQLVLALGRPSPNGIEASLGVVSAVGGPVRTRRGALLERYLRTDTIPYPGFSGGPLIDAAGGVVGMNTSGLAHGMALTVPAGLVWQIADSLAQHGRVKRGYLGVRSQPVELSDEVQQALGRQQELGLLMVGVEKNSPASAGGLMVGDILVSLAGSPISDPDELVSRLSGSIVGSPTQVEILRGGQRMTLTVVIGERK
jgi:S1-C subfamily serine protease